MHRLVSIALFVAAVVAGVFGQAPGLGALLIVGWLLDLVLWKRVTQRRQPPP